MSAAALANDAKLVNLKVELWKAGKFQRYVEFDDPREKFCEGFNGAMQELGFEAKPATEPQFFELALFDPLTGKIVDRDGFFRNTEEGLAYCRKVIEFFNENRGGRQTTHVLGIVPAVEG